jgi:DNA-binding CsgD family transcriptional regulator
VQLAWPFVGREDELELVARARRDGACGVVVSGAAGVGKSRLAREALAAAAGLDGRVEWIQATEAAAAVPLGAFAALVPSGVRADDRLQLFGLCAEALRGSDTSARVPLGVDDAHLLDASSAALVLHLVTSGTAFVVATVRSGKRCPDPIVALWKDLGAPRLELQKLSADETAELLERVLEGTLGMGVAQWGYGASEGHVLYLRELVKGALASGALAHEDGVWRLQSRPGVPPALADLMTAGLEGLTAEELDALRLLALGEPLPLDAVTGIVGLAAVAGLEEKGLLLVDASATPGGAADVRLSHPLYGEVVRGAIPTVLGGGLRLRLAKAVLTRGLPRPGDALRVVTWLDDAGARPEPTLLLAAAREANAVGDPELAERLVLRAPAGPEAALILASTFARRRRFVEADAVLAPWGEALPRSLALAHVEQRAVEVLHLGLGRADEAQALLNRAQRWFEDPEWADHLYLIRSLLLLLSKPTDRPADAVENLERLLARGDLSAGVRRRASIAKTQHLYEGGRFSEALAWSAQLRPTVPLLDVDDANALIAWWSVRLEAGYEWDAVERWLAEADLATARADDPLTRGEVVTWLAWTAVRRGRPVTATRRAREAIGLLERSDPVHRLPLAWLVLALGAAMRGDGEAARSALAGYEVATGGVPVPYLRRVEVAARAALNSVEGETRRAAAVLLDAAATGEGDLLDRAHLLYDALRSGADSRMVAAALRDLPAAAAEAPIVQVYTRVAEALVARDGDNLVAAAQAFGEIGAWLSAAEAAALAAHAYGEAGRADSARRAGALSARFSNECEDAWSPVLATLKLAPAELTAREQEVVLLAAGGAPNAEIAARLFLSTRTVESHLYRAMRKLGVSSRDDL